MIVTVEPGIYIEGRGGVRLEEMILLKNDGNRLLNRNRNFYDFSTTAS
jgi:Xaa-Pro aminopeptidase